MTLLNGVHLVSEFDVKLAKLILDLDERTGVSTSPLITRVAATSVVPAAPHYETPDPESNLDLKSGAREEVTSAATRPSRPRAGTIPPLEQIYLNELSFRAEQESAETRVETLRAILVSEAAHEQSATSTPDANLLSRCRDGDAQAWEELVNRYSQLLATVASRAGLAHHDVDDVVQSTFIALFESGVPVSIEESLASWLVTVARRKAWRIRRRIEMAEEYVENPTESDPLRSTEQAQVIQRALEQLGGPCQRLLTMMYLDIDVPSYVEIAERLGMAVGSIGPNRARCLAKLRQIIGDDIRLM